MKRQLITVGVLMVFGMMSFSARPLGTEDFGTAERGKSALEWGYNNEQTSAFVVKHVPLEGVELSAEYEVPVGASFAFDQVVLNVEVNLAKNAFAGLNYGVKVKYDHLAQTLGLIAIAALEDESYCIHTNTSFEPESPLTFSIAGEWLGFGSFQPVVEAPSTGADINGLIGARYQVFDGSFVDAAATFPISGLGTRSQFIGLTSEF